MTDVTEERQETTAAPSTELRVEPDRVVLVATGDIDIATASNLADALREACAIRRDVVIDLRDVTFLDVYSLRCIDAARRTLETWGRTVSLVNPQGSTRRVLELTGMLRLVPAQDS